ncbi:EAL domain-containing protein [Martelella alba]|uniref:cyclic-guanylate-specific phosphodiesterase n=1 Tax=Martelella alba TaxID=2590451 RepID=A0ABY2SMK0_9HYPH|nr:EAL domain-containing protein [Martelella alba]TKI04858.1 EAL domain-containing protein [Martelella alba]
MRSPLDVPVLAKLSDKHLMLLWVILPLCFFIFSLCIVGYYAQLNLKKQADRDINSTIKFIDNVLNDAGETAELALPLIGKPCAAVVDQLRILSVKHSLVRAVTLFHNNQVYCGPVPLPLSWRALAPVSRDSDNSPIIALRRGTSLFPGVAVILFNKYRGDDGASAIVDTEYLHYMMNVAGSDNRIMMIIHDRYLTSQGTLVGTAHLTNDFITVSGTSRNYPYRLQINIDRGRFFDYILDTYGTIILFSVIVSLAISLLIRNWSKALTSIRSSMAQGLKRNEFEAFFQPVMDASENYCIGIEVLARWRHPTDGVVSPEIFIPLAEESGLVIPLTRHLMRQVATTIARSPIRWRAHLHIAVNISAIHLTNWQIVEDCREFLSSVKDKHIALLLELTERQFIDVTEDALLILSALQQMGVSIAIDDFGTGYSGLSYLSKMNIDYLKLDKSFVSMIEHESSTKIIVDVVIDLAKKLNMEIIAEGVENRVQRNYLLEKKVIYQQGFLYAKPLPIAQFQQYFSQYLDRAPPNYRKHKP